MLAVSAAVVLWACQKEKYPDDAIDAQIAKSVEMENYIVAGYELQTALVEFQKELNKVDFSKLEFVPGKDGKLVMRVPIPHQNFIEKLKALNMNRSALQSRFPELAGFALERKNSIIESCIAYSITVATKLLDMGINVMLPATKRLPESFEDSMEFLGGWTAGSHYVEAVIVVYRDGSSCIYIDPSNTYKSSTYPPLKHANGTDLFYYPEGGSNSPILFIGHTHLSDGEASPKDRETAIDGLREAVYYNDNFYPYDKNGNY